jgi:hypothetical protein
MLVLCRTGSLARNANSALKDDERCKRGVKQQRHTYDGEWRMAKWRMATADGGDDDDDDDDANLNSLEKKDERQNNNLKKE